MKKLVKESLYSNYPEEKQQFLEWLENIVKDNYTEDWEFIISMLVNDENSYDEEIAEYLEKNGVNERLVAELMSKRTEFLNYGLDIQL